MWSSLDLLGDLLPYNIKVFIYVLLLLHIFALV